MQSVYILKLVKTDIYCPDDDDNEGVLLNFGSRRLNKAKRFFVRVYKSDFYGTTTLMVNGKSRKFIIASWLDQEKQKTVKLISIVSHNNINELLRNKFRVIKLNDGNATLEGVTYTYSFDKAIKLVKKLYANLEKGNYPRKYNYFDYLVDFEKMDNPKMRLSCIRYDNDKKLSEIDRTTHSWQYTPMNREYIHDTRQEILRLIYTDLVNKSFDDSLRHYSFTEKYFDEESIKEIETFLTLYKNRDSLKKKGDYEFSDLSFAIRLKAPEFIPLLEESPKAYPGYIDEIVSAFYDKHIEFSGLHYDFIGNDLSNKEISFPIKVNKSEQEEIINKLNKKNTISLSFPRTGKASVSPNKKFQLRVVFKIKDKGDTYSFKKLHSLFDF